MNVSDLIEKLQDFYGHIKVKVLTHPDAKPLEIKKVRLVSGVIMLETFSNESL